MVWILYGPSSTSLSTSTWESMDILNFWYGMVWYGLVWYGMVWYGMDLVWTLLHFLVHFHLGKYGHPQFLVWYGMVWFGMVWYGMVWYGSCMDPPPLPCPLPLGKVWTSSISGMVWYGMVWYGMVWYGMVWILYGPSSTSLSTSTWESMDNWTTSTSMYICPC